MAGGGQAAEVGADLGEEAAHLALLGVELAGEVADVRGVDVAGFHRDGVERAVDGLGHHVAQVVLFLAPVAGEVGLVSAEDVGLGHRGSWVTVGGWCLRGRISGQSVEFVDELPDFFQPLGHLLNTLVVLVEVDMKQIR